MLSLHSPPYEFGSCVTIGSTDALAKVLTLLNGDSVLFDEYAYGTAVSACRTYGRTSIGVKMDANGMIPTDLKEQTIAARDKGLDPDVVYLVPVAQNPTGISMSPTRKEEIYRVCQDLDLFIVEDDAYYYLYHGIEHRVDAAFDMTSMPGLHKLPRYEVNCIIIFLISAATLLFPLRSFLSMDSDGRVIRMDSLSKFICPGMRLGWVSAHPEFTDKYEHAFIQCSPRILQNIDHCNFI